MNKETRQAFIEEAEKSWKEYQKTGEHVTLKEVINWLESWGEKKDKTPPRYHT